MNVVQESPDNIAQEKILINVVLILLGQHSTGKNLVQCCRRGCRQHGTGKVSFNVFLILMLYAMLSLRLNTLGTLNTELHR